MTICQCDNCGERIDRNEDITVTSEGRAGRLTLKVQASYAKEEAGRWISGGMDICKRCVLRIIRDAK